MKPLPTSIALVISSFQLEQFVEETGWTRGRLRRDLKSYHRQDASFRDSEILGSMCSAPAADAIWAANRFVESNLGDPAHFEGTRALEQAVLADALELTNAPKTGAARFLTGGTEANLLALYIAREVTGRDEIVLPTSAHFSFEKAARMLRMTLKYVDIRADGRSDPIATRKAITRKTAIVIAVGGSTEFGLVDDIAVIADGAHQKGVHCHVDGAYGGYILPFLKEATGVTTHFDFRVKGVTSVSLDPHKGGMSTIPGGMLVLRDGELWKSIGVDAPYVSSGKQSQLLGTRPGAAVAACYAAHRANGRAGYIAAVKHSMKLRDKLWSAIPESARIFPPELGVVTFKVNNPEEALKLLSEKGLHLNKVPRYQAIRVVLNPHVREFSVDKLIQLLPAVL